MFSFQEMDVRTQHHCKQLADDLIRVRQQDGPEAAVKMYVRMNNLIGFFLGGVNPPFDITSPAAIQWATEEQTRIIAECAPAPAQEDITDWLQSMASYFDQLAEGGESNGRTV